jgi:DNA-binding ferritin-like protein
MGRTMKQREDVKDSEENLDALRKERTDLDAEFQSEIAAMDKKNDPLTEAFEKLTIAAKKSSISVRLCALVWNPNP